MGVRAARWAPLAAALACLATACGTSGSTAHAPPAGPSAPATTLPRAEGALRLLARQGYAENSWVKPFERSTGLPRRGALRRQRRGPAARGRRLGLRRRVDPGRPRLRRRAGRRGARAQPRARAAARELPRALPRPGGGRARTRRYGVAFLWSPRLLLWRKSIRKHAPATWAPLSWNTKARRGRVALEDTPLEIGDAALSLRKLRPTLGISDPYALDENQFAAAVALTKRRVHLAGALWQLPGDEIDAFDGGLVDVGAGDWYTAQQIRDQNVDVGLTLPREGAPGEIDLWMLGAHALHPGCAYRWMRYASGARCRPRWRATSAPRPSTPTPAPLLGAASCHALHADAPAALLKRIAFRHTPVENCGGGRRLRAVRALGAGLERLLRRGVADRRGHGTRRIRHPRLDCAA